ncbi:hypothetical protein GJ744_000861 [Endocarpon pusillum]|uniref:AB hydrolase-1 domain-containing protein n=1 Tax=Endocarpon pusillum TaxID=364733 RepID=A0A8H7AWY2_9EURO|nr:hypothetical protein GJ744_000861 [Endocarpon pusillum]
MVNHQQLHAIFEISIRVKMSEKVADYVNQCRPVVWKEHDLRAADGTPLKLLEGGVDLAAKHRKRVTVLYFQGNASSLPPRLPYLSAVLKALDAAGDQISEHTGYSIYALSYRGFWTSRGRASQSGIELDAQAALTWLTQNVRQGPHIDTTFVLWGQSVGAGVATTALATLLTQQYLNAAGPQHQNLLNTHSLILETPFLSIRSMLTTLYPQKYLPYRYLWPFLRSTWDSGLAVKKIAVVATAAAAAAASHPKPNPSSRNGPSAIVVTPPIVRKVLILQAGKDEIVPAEQSEALERICRENLPGAIEVERLIVAGALHTEVMAKPQGRGAVVRHLRAAAENH